jgi:hypothetical protein
MIKVLTSVMLSVHKCFVVRSSCHVCGANTSDIADSVYVHTSTAFIQSVPGVKVTTSGFNSRADSESKTSYTHGSNSRFRSYEFLNYSK